MTDILRNVKYYDKSSLLIWLWQYRHSNDWSVMFSLKNGNVDNPYCNGMEGILEAYHESLKTVQLYGPTNFAPVINHVAR